MPDKEIKKKSKAQQNNVAPASVATTEPSVAEQRKAEAAKGVLGRPGAIDPSSAPTTTTTTTGLKGEEIKTTGTDTLTANALKRAQKQQESQLVTNAINDIYNNQAMEFGARISEMEEAKRKAKEEDETMQRKARNMQMIAGISDGLASLANLIGVSKGGSNITTGSALSPLEKKFEAARLERKADIKTIDERLEQYKNQMMQMQLARGNAQIASAEKQADRAFTTSERLGKQQFEEGQLDKKLAADMVKTNATIQSNAYQKALDRKARIDAARIRANGKSSSGSSKQPEEFIFTDGTGRQKVYSLPANRTEAILKDFDTAIAADLKADTTTDDNASEFRSAYNEYKKISQQRGVGMATDQQVKDARNALISASPTLKKAIEKYGKVVEQDEFAANRL